MKGKHCGHKNNYMDNLSGKQCEVSEDRWRWLRKRFLKRTNEALIMATQEQAIRTNNIKANIDKTQENSKYRMCEKPKDSVNHALSECSNQSKWSIKNGWIGFKGRFIGKYIENMGCK